MLAKMNVILSNAGNDVFCTSAKLHHSRRGHSVDATCPPERAPTSVFEVEGPTSCVAPWQGLPQRFQKVSCARGCFATSVDRVHECFAARSAYARDKAAIL